MEQSQETSDSPPDAQDSTAELSLPVSEPPAITDQATPESPVSLDQLALPSSEMGELEQPADIDQNAPEAALSLPEATQPTTPETSQIDTDAPLQELDLPTSRAVVQGPLPIDAPASAVPESAPSINLDLPTASNSESLVAGQVESPSALDSLSLPESAGDGMTSPEGPAEDSAESDLSDLSLPNTQANEQTSPELESEPAISGLDLPESQATAPAAESLTAEEALLTPLDLPTAMADSIETEQSLPHPSPDDPLSVPATTDLELPESEVMPHPHAATQSLDLPEGSDWDAPESAPPPLAQSVPTLELPEFDTIDMRRGFAGPGGTRSYEQQEQMAHVDRYDNGIDELYESQVSQQRLQRDYNARNYDLMHQFALDLNNDFRRIDDLERQYEISRETVTDVNL
jgi:hypothetical protein